MLPTGMAMAVIRMKKLQESVEKVCKRVNFCCWTWLMDGELGSGRADSGGMTAVTP